ncbi:MAG: AsmA-like C-terminal region-containing protein [Pseudomonadota bacterium]
MHWVVKLALGVASIPIFFAGIVAIVLAVPVFSDLRTSLVSQVLTDQIGHPIAVEEDVAVKIGRTIRFEAAGVKVSTEGMPKVLQAELDQLNIDIDLLDLIRGEVNPDNLILDGLRLNLEVDGSLRNADEPQDDVVPQDAEGDNMDSELNLISFLRTRTVDISNIELFVANSQSGFELDFLLEVLSLEQQDDGKTLAVFGQGALNGQSFDLNAHFPDNEPFRINFDFLTAHLTYHGTPSSGGYEEGYDADFSLEASELREFFDALKLRAALGGNASFKAEVAVSPDRVELAAFAADVNLQSGKYLGLSGSVDDLFAVEGVQFDARARLYPEGIPPPAAATITDLKVIEIVASLEGGQGNYELEEFLIKSNAAQEELNELGPLRIGRLYRAEDGRLSVEDAYIQGGPREAPILKMSGDVLNLLEFQEIDIAGEIDAPAALILSRLDEDHADTFGKLHATFALDDRAGDLRLTEFTAQARDTDVWTLDARAKSESVRSIDGVEVDVELDLPDGAQFLSALKRKPIETGPLGFHVSLQGQSTGATADLGLTVKNSDLQGKIRLDTSRDRARIEADIVSDSTSLSEVKTGMAGVREILALVNGKVEGAPRQAVAEEHTELEPLVLPTEEASNAELFDPIRMLVETDVYGSAELKQVIGIPGLSTVSSEFMSEGGQVRLGPLDVAFAGGYFNFNATMDAVHKPHLVSVSGATGGWDLADILKTAGVEFEASGKLAGTFSLRGNRTNLDSFLSTMYGKAEVDLSEGQVASSLLELAGLGVFPWLFSAERRQGYTDIVCIQAPVQVSAGRVSFDSVVAETRSVQMVSRGHLDWNADEVAIRSEPRPVGKPLARAAWPFDVNGKLSKPKFKLDVGGSRQKRADGAHQMPENRVPCQRDILQLQ